MRENSAPSGKSLIWKITTFIFAVLLIPLIAIITAVLLATFTVFIIVWFAAILFLWIIGQEIEFKRDGQIFATLRWFKFAQY